MASNCNNFNIDGMTGYDLTLHNPTIIGGTVSGVVIARDCGGAAILTGASLATCANLNTAINTVTASVDQLRNDTTAKLAAKQDQLKRMDGTNLAGGACVMTCDEVRTAIAEEVSCGLRGIVDCHGQPICDGAAIATCRDLDDAIAGVSGASFLDCKGAAVPSGTRIATCADLAEAVAGVTADLVDCNGTKIAKGAAVVTCANLDAAFNFAVAVAPTTSEAGPIPTTYFGLNTAYLGMPVAWVELTVAGVKRRAPVY